MEQHHDLRRVQAVDEPGELLGLVLDLVQVEPDRDLVQVDRRAEVGRRHDVLDLVGELVRDIDAEVPQDTWDSIVAGLIFNIPALSLMVSAGFVLFASAAILYQTSEIVHRAGETNYILATVTLYVSIYNLFISLLSILGIMSND